MNISPRKDSFRLISAITLAAWVGVFQAPSAPVQAQSQVLTLSTSESTKVDGVTFSNHQLVATDLTAPFAQTLTALTAALPAQADIDAIVVISPTSVYFSLDADTFLGGTKYADDDIIFWDGSSFSLAWSGSVNGLPASADIDALDIISESPLEFVFSLDAAARLTVGGVPTLVGDSDLVHFLQGSGFTAIDFNAPAAGVPAGANLDALARIQGSEAVVSFDRPVRLGGHNFDDSDLIFVTGGTTFFSSPLLQSFTSRIPPAADLDAAHLNTLEPDINPSFPSLAFGNQDIDLGATAALTVTISNFGTSVLNISSLAIAATDSSQFAITSDTAEAVLNPGESRIVMVTFNPTSLGPKAASLRVISNDPDESTLDVLLTGTGTDQEIDFSVASVNYTTQVFDSSSPETLPFVISNIGTANLGLGAPLLVGPNAGEFQITSDTGQALLIPGATRTLQIKFTPTSIGTKNASIRVISNDTDEGTVDTPLVASIIEQEIDFSVAVLDYGIELFGVSAPKTLTLVITNTGTANLNVGSPGILGPDLGQFSIASDTMQSVLTPASTRTIMVTFTPTSLGQKNALIRITSSDTDEGQVDIPLLGLVLAPSSASRAAWMRYE